MQAPATRSPAQPAVVLGLTFLLIGLTFALPFRLVPADEVAATSEHWSAEVGNVYACVAWAGWAHFLFAFRGQRNALARLSDGLKTGRLLAFVGCVALTVAVLFGVRWAVGPSLFAAVVWVYFIDHFIKAEQSFEGHQSANVPLLVRWLSLYQPLLTFGWLSVVLLNVGQINDRLWLVWTVSLLLAIVVLAFGGWKKLALGDARATLLSLFFIAEALVWGAFSPYGGPMFLAGVYVFHIAAGSYFHYLGSYFYAQSRSRARDVMLTPLAILGINLLIVALGYAVARYDVLTWLRPVLGIQWFALWVGTHLVVSDVFPLIKGWGMRPVPTPGPS